MASRRAQRSCSPVRDGDAIRFLSQPAPGVHRAADDWRETTTTTPKATPSSPSRAPEGRGDLLASCSIWRVAASELGYAWVLDMGASSKSKAVPSQVCSGAGLRTVMHPMHPKLHQATRAHGCCSSPRTSAWPTRASPGPFAETGTFPAFVRSACCAVRAHFLPVDLSSAVPFSLLHAACPSVMPARDSCVRLTPRPQGCN
jgi:hypothetical protein